MKTPEEWASELVDGDPYNHEFAHNEPSYAWCAECIAKIIAAAVQEALAERDKEQKS